MKEIKEIVEDGMEIGGSKSPDEIVEDKVLCKSGGVDVLSGGSCVNIEMGASQLNEAVSLGQYMDKASFEESENLDKAAGFEENMYSSLGAWFSCWGSFLCSSLEALFGGVHRLVLLAAMW